MKTNILGAHIKMRNGRVARNLAVLQGARKESAMRDSAQPKSGHLTGRAWEAHILYGSSTGEQRSSSVKDRQPGGLFSGGRLAALLLSHRALAMLLRRALPAARHKTARPFRILIWALKPLAAILVAAAILALAAFPAFAQSDTNQLHALVLAERGDQHEAFVVAALEWLKATAATDHLAIDVFENPNLFTKRFLAKYQVIIQLNYPPYRWSDEAKAAFQDYIEQGRGGWVGLHHATLLGEFDGYPMWPWFSDFMGGIRFKNYIAKRVAGTVVVEDPVHPCLKGVPATFVVGEEEWYTYDKDPRPNVHVLAHVDESSYQPSSDIKMGDHPVIWTNERMKARNIYILMGHHPSLFTNEVYKTLLRNAILWAAGDKSFDKSGAVQTSSPTK